MSARRLYGFEPAVRRSRACARLDFGGYLLATPMRRSSRKMNVGAAFERSAPWSMVLARAARQARWR
jgi:hypothetical protein